MPTLNWLGKDAVVDHHRKVPLRLLADDPALAIAGAGSTTGGLVHTLIEGDNLHALKALLPRYRGRVDCIYIDPPYNTGNEGWIYNDNVNSPLMRDWLKREVGRDDLSRHDKWLCMMYPRLVLMRELLAQDGVIFISIDGTELANLGFLCDEVFGVDQRVGTIVWKNVTDNNPTLIVPEHEYVVCYAKEKNTLPVEWKSLELMVKRRLLDIGDALCLKFKDLSALQKEYSKWYRENKDYIWPFQDYKFIDQNGIYAGIRGVHNPGKEGYRYDVLHPKTGKPCKLPLMGYRFPQETMRDLLANGRILFGEDETKIIELKVYARDYRAKLSSVIELDGRIGTNEIKDIFPESKRPFNFPKPSVLIQELLSFVTSNDDIILDAFAGSGTTGQAVMALNAADGGRRECVLIQLGQDQAGGANIAQTITRERLARVSQGYTNAKGETVAGLKQAWRYQRLGESFTDGWGMPRTDLPFADLAPIVFFHATQEPIPQPAHDRAFLGVSSAGVGVYLLYNGDMSDKDGRSRNVLTQGMLERLHPHPGPRIVYGAACRIDARELADARIAFRQYPKALAEVAS